MVTKGSSSMVELAHGLHPRSPKVVKLVHGFHQESPRVVELEVGLHQGCFIGEQEVSWDGEASDKALSPKM